MAKILLLLAPLVLLASVGCSSAPPDGDEEGGDDGLPARDGPRWAIAVHGGAGVISRSLPEEVREGYIRSLREALEAGREMLAAGSSSLETVEAVVLRLEDDPRFNAGKGAVYTNAGTHELDASIMDGRSLAAGAVAAVKTVRNPITLARLVMEETPHVLLCGEGADAFAREMGIPAVEQDYFHTERRREQWERARERARVDGQGERREEHEKGTVGAVALDVRGDLAAATSTGGLTNKRFGRIGDSPIVGAGTYARNGTCAVSGTGTGEAFIRHAIAHTVSALMELRGLPVGEAARIAVFERLGEGEGGVIAVSHTGEIAMPFNTRGMFRGAADSEGRLEVRIWE